MKNTNITVKYVEHNTKQKQVYFIFHHRKSVHEKVKYNCHACDKEFTSKAGLSDHLKAIHLEANFDCQECNFKTSRKANLIKHNKSYHSGLNEKVACQSCDKMFANKITMAIHIKSKHLQVNYQCNVCDFITNSKDNLSQHV